MPTPTDKEVEIEELANKRCLEFIKSFQYSSVKTAIEGVYIQGCIDMANALLSKPPKSPAGWPADLSDAEGTEFSPAYYEEGWNDCRKAFMKVLKERNLL